MGNSHLLAVLVPVFNEESTLREVISRILSQPAISEVVFIDDGSTDRSAAIGRSIAAANAKVRFLRHETNLGKGAAIRTGLRVVRTEFTVI